MKKPTVLIADRFDQGTFLQARANDKIQFYYSSKLKDLSQYYNECEGLIIRSSTKVDKDFLKSFPQLKFVITATSGFDHLDLKELKAKKISCFHVPQTQSLAAAEMTLLMILACCRKFHLAQKQIHKGDWQRELLAGKQLQGQTLGIIGLGRVGLLVARKALALGLKVQAYDPYLTDHYDDVPMFGYEEMMRSSDIVSIHVPRTKKTRHMLKKETLSWLHTESILINMSRGDVIHEEDLIHHLKINPQAMAGLDVFDKEPLSLDSELFQLNNVVLSPHIGASTGEALKSSSQEALKMAKAFLNGVKLENELPPKAPWWDE